MRAGGGNLEPHRIPLTSYKSSTSVPGIVITCNTLSIKARPYKGFRVSGARIYGILGGFAGVTVNFLKWPRAEGTVCFERGLGL